MTDHKVIQRALVSVFNKDGLAPLARQLHARGIGIYSTGGTADFITAMGIPVETIEQVTGYPSILGGRVKTLHPKVFGGILARRQNPSDTQETTAYGIPLIDLVIVDLYPFVETLQNKNATPDEIIEKIDIGGVALIRATAKNFDDVVIISEKTTYAFLSEVLDRDHPFTTLMERKDLAAKAFRYCSEYDHSISSYLDYPTPEKILRYGENPHQQGVFKGDLGALLTQLNGKALSYNNLVDLDASIDLIKEFKEPTFAIVKHTNACGVASAQTAHDAYVRALAGDPISAFGGVIATNGNIDIETAVEINKIFFEVLVAPDFEPEALELLREKKNRIIVKLNSHFTSGKQRVIKSALNGLIEQSADDRIEGDHEMKRVTKAVPSKKQIEDLEFALKVVKHQKSNAITLVKDAQLIGSGVGQTSRVDALEQAIAKARNYGFTTEGAVMASDAFFPFPDCVQIASAAGIKAIVQPGGSIKDDDSIRESDKLQMAMVFTGIRHFKH